MQISIFSASLVAAFVLLAAPAMAQGGPPANQGGKPTTLDSLSCSSGEIARVNTNGVWECSGAATEFETQGALVDDQLGLSWKTIFITSQTYGGILGGLAGADFICQQHADRAGLAGRFKAWLSDADWSPKDRFTRSSVPYRNPLHETVASDYAQLTSCTEGVAEECLDVPLLVDEFGNELFFDPNLTAWTNTLPNGAAAATISLETCQGWTSNLDVARIGSLEFTDYRWTHPAAFSGCGSEARLICVEQ